MRKTWLLAAVLAASAVPALGQTNEELNSDGKNTDNVVTQSMGLDRKSYSPLAQINKSNIKRLVPIWSTSLMSDMGELAAPVVYDGVIYAINAKWTFAIDAETGRQIRRTPVQTEPGMTRAGSAIYRGAPTIYDGKLFRVTVDNHIVALEMKTGRVLWNKKFAEWKEGYHSSGAPIVANGVLISGVAGGEFDHARLPRRLGSRHRREALAPLHHSGARRAGLGDLAGEQRRLEIRRRLALALGLLRSAARPGLLGRRQRRALRPAAARSPRQPLHRQRAGVPAEDRRDRLLLPVHAERCLRRGRHRRAGAGRSADRRADAQGDDPVEQERLHVRAGSHQLQADRRPSLYQGQLGERRRPHHRPPAAHRHLQGLPRRRRGRDLPLARLERGADRLRSDQGAGLCGAVGHAAPATARAAQAAGDRRELHRRERAPAADQPRRRGRRLHRDRSADRAAEMGSLH